MDISHLKPHQKVSLVWSDSSYKKGWHYPPYKFGEPERRVKSLGYVVQVRDSVLTLASSMDQDGGALCPVFVPAHAIQQLEVLGESD